MQETRVNKVSRRFYIDHADDHAVVRTVPVIKEVRPAAATAPAPQTEPVAPARERRLSKLVPAAVRRPLRKHG
jgi:hypothetical protein